jgi:hypothetical protein
MLNFIIALFVKKDLLSEEEGRKLSKALFGRPIPDEYDLALPFVERLLAEAKLSSTRKYFDPALIGKKDKKIPVASKK